MQRQSRYKSTLRVSILRLAVPPGCKSVSFQPQFHVQPLESQSKSIKPVNEDEEIELVEADAKAPHYVYFANPMAETLPADLGFMSARLQLVKDGERTVQPIDRVRPAYAAGRRATCRLRGEIAAEAPKTILTGRSRLCVFCRARRLGLLTHSSSRLFPNLRQMCM